MVSNLKSQLAPLGIAHRLPEVLEEAARVRRDLGYPIIVSPFAQFVMTQAVLNVMGKERYATVPDEVRKYVLGYYGEIAGPIDPNLYDRITNGAKPTSARPGDLLEPGIPKIRRERGPFASDDDLLLAAFYARREYDALKAAGPINTTYPLASTPLLTLLKEITQRRDIRSIHLVQQARYMTTPAIITVAITGAIPRKADTPAVPVTPSEQIKSTHEAFEAGASVVHIHVRNPDESPSSDPDLFAQVQEGVAKHCPKMIIQFSTGGRGRSQKERGRMLYLKPDMASLATGSVNFAVQIYENPPQLVEELARSMLEFNVKPEIEVFDIAMLYNAKIMADRGLLKRPCQVQFVMGIPNALPVRRKLLEFLIAELKDLMPDATWSAAGIGRHQLEVNEWCLELGGHVRTGIEDNIKFDKNRLARSNGELVTRLAGLCSSFGRHPASPAEARKILQLPTE